MLARTTHLLLATRHKLRWLLLRRRRYLQCLMTIIGFRGWLDLDAAAFVHVRQHWGEETIDGTATVFGTRVEVLKRAVVGHRRLLLAAILGSVLHRSSYALCAGRVLGERGAVSTTATCTLTSDERVLVASTRRQGRRSVVLDFLRVRSPGSSHLMVHILSHFSLQRTTPGGGWAKLRAE